MLLVTLLMLVTYIWHIFATTSPIYSPERYGTYGMHVNCDGHIFLWVNTIHHFINGVERQEMKEAVK